MIAINKEFYQPGNNIQAVCFSLLAPTSFFTSAIPGKTAFLLYYSSKTEMPLIYEDVCFCMTPSSYRILTSSPKNHVELFTMDSHQKIHAHMLKKGVLILAPDPF